MNFRAIIDAVKARFSSKPIEPQANGTAVFNNGATPSIPIRMVAAPAAKNTAAPVVQKTSAPPPTVNNKPRRKSATLTRLQALSASGTGSAQTPTSAETSLKFVLDDLDNLNKS